MSHFNIPELFPRFNSSKQASMQGEDKLHQIDLLPASVYTTKQRKLKNSPRR